MKVIVCKDSEQLGVEAAKLVAAEVKRCIAEKGSVRIVFSTGASQFDTFKALLKEDIDWSKVDMFHLDEYVDLPETHLASFRKFRCPSCLFQLYVPSSLRKHSVLVPGFIWLLSPCSTLPAPTLNLHRLRPIPLGCPFASFSVLKSQSATWRRTLSVHVPTYCMLHASDAPKPSMVWRTESVFISK